MSQPATRAAGRRRKVRLFACAESREEIPTPTYDIEVTRDGPWYMIAIPALWGLTQALEPCEIEYTARDSRPVHMSSGRGLGVVRLRQLNGFSAAGFGLLDAP